MTSLCRVCSGSGRPGEATLIPYRVEVAVRHARDRFVLVADRVTGATDLDLDHVGVRVGRVVQVGTIGATRSAWVGLGNDGFELERDDGRVVRGAWPGTTFPGWGYLPAFESPAGVFIAGNVDFGPVLGWLQSASLAWVQVPRTGGAGVPYGDENAVGMFLLGIEIPRPEQPLRYWGCRR